MRGLKSILFLSTCGLLASQAPASGDSDPSKLALPFEIGLRRAVVSPGALPERLRLSDRMAHHKVPGVSVAIIRGCQVAVSRGYGLKEAGRGAVTLNTRFQAASISKPVASLAALRLVEQGRLRLDRNINSTLHSWKLPESKLTSAHPVTLRHLLSHGAGLTVHGFGGYPAGEPVPTINQILNGEPPANSAAVRVDQVPGSAWRYSGGGFTIAQLLMTETTNKAFPRLMRDLALTPAGMARSTYEQPLPGKMAAEAASGHRPDGSVLPGRWHTYPEMAAAGLWTTPSDLARFAIAIMRAERGSGKAIVTQATAREMLRPQIGEFGLGLSVSGSGAAQSFRHGGSNAGYRAYMIAFPRTCQGAAVMTNSDNGDSVIREVLRSLADTEKWPDPFKSEERASIRLSPEERARIVGSYRLTTDPSTTFELVEEATGELTLRLLGASRGQVEASSATLLFLRDDGTTIEVNPADGKTPGSLTIKMAGGQSYEAERIAPPR